MNFIEANGVSLRYAVEGAGKPVVLIHEMGGMMESWGHVAPLLAASRRVIRYDTRGAGFSEKIRSAITIDTMTDDLIALLDGIGIGGKGRAGRHRGRRRDCAAHRIPLSRTDRRLRRHQPGDLDPAGQSRCHA